MNFSSPIFLFAFLPLVLAAYHLLRPMRAKNALLIAAGLIFYAFGDLRHLPLLLASCVLHYFSGVFLLTRKKGRKAVLAACITVDLSVLAAYKSFGTLPLGISFYTFQAISYVVDVYRSPEHGTRSFRQLLQYLTFFPQLVSGPLMKFSDVRESLDARTASWDGAFDGVCRFVCGLAKKLLLAAAAAELANAVYVPRAALTRSASGRAQSATAFSSISISPATATWLSVSVFCLGFGCRKTSITPTALQASAPSGAGGTCPCPAGSAIISTFRLTETGGARCAQCATSSSSFSPRASGTETA